MERVSIILLVSNPSDNHSATKRSTVQLDADSTTADYRLLTVGCAQLPQQFVAGRDYVYSILYRMWVDSERGSDQITLSVYFGTVEIGGCCMLVDVARAVSAVSV